MFNFIINNSNKLYITYNEKGDVIPLVRNLQGKVQQQW